MELRWTWICYGCHRKIVQSLDGLLIMFLLAVGHAQESKAHFAGSESCKACHAKEYNGWKQTRMANVVRDPREHPEAVVGDFTHADPLRTFDLDQVAFVYGSRWKQRYFTKRGDDYFPLPAQWDVKKGKWLPYHVEAGTDWWVPFYGPTNFDRPTGPTCDGCHSVNYDIQTKHVTHCDRGSVLVLELLNVKTFRQRCPELYEAVVDGVASVNWRRLETGDPAVLTISFRL
jgi:hypothetical protein